MRHLLFVAVAAPLFFAACQGDFQCVSSADCPTGYVCLPDSSHTAHCIAQAGQTATTASSGMTSSATSGTSGTSSSDTTSGTTGGTSGTTTGGSTTGGI